MTYSYTIMQSLPNELLAQIALHLADQAPSITKFHHEPSSQLTDSDSKPLKTISLVSRRWRKVVLPILFRYARIALDKEALWVPMDARLVDSMQGELSKLSNHEFMIYTKLRSKFKSTSGSAFKPAMDDVLIQLCRIQDGDEHLKATLRAAWIPHLSKDFDRFTQFVTQNDLKRHIKSLVVHTDQEYNLWHVSTAHDHMLSSVTDIWTKTFSCLDPTRIVVAAPPKTMAALVDSAVGTNDNWAFEMKMHYIELLQKEPPNEKTSNSETRYSSCQLLRQRPWHHLGYNEGSSITVYSTYEFHLMVPPRILELLLYRIASFAKKTKFCRHFTSFSFTAVFPLLSGLTPVLCGMHMIPSITSATFQLAPGPESDLLSDASKRRKAQSSDFWSEWRMGYKQIADFEFFRQGKMGGAKSACRTLTEIVSKDCYTGQLNDEVTEAVEGGLKGDVFGWKGDGVGRWARDTEEGEHLVQEEN
ncbi:hypothetical protein J4E90_010444 [Alternaria incomplexa]|uniref:uncharacterized protein n=1 Tax=Alternaria incomplexa TaxID=1187928 RepID=UPI00221E9D68|nr:uncharacterized protein J4E90_010444 [Alternaria incomplexa]KAI4906550.1 hypothetical protein J4E90_010444 [Alternaria incomplexa]